MKEKMKIEGMTCSACQAHVEKSVRALEGVIEANVNLLLNTMNVEYDEQKVSEQDIIRAVESGGYGAVRSIRRHLLRQPKRVRQKSLRRKRNISSSVYGLRSFYC